MTPAPGPVATPRPTRRFLVHAVLAAGGLLAAVLVRTPALVVLAAPSLVLLAVDLTWRPGGSVRATVTIVPERLLEGGEGRVVVHLTTAERSIVEVTVALPDHLRTRTAPAWTVTLQAGRRHDLTVAFDAPTWGGGTVGPVRIRRTSPGGLFDVHSVADVRAPVRVLPPPASARALVRPSRTHVGTGNRTSRARGGGTEFAELRPFVAGDRARDVNWRVSSRRGSPWVTDRHPDRRVDVVLLVDAYDPEHLDDVRRAALALADGYLATHDRVGVTSLGGAMRWLEPGAGRAHGMRIAEALLDMRVLVSWAEPNVTSLSAHTIPPGALTLVLTPATDPRMTTVAVGLRARGRDVAVIVLEPVPPSATDAVGALAVRLLALERRAARDRLHLRGLPAVGWDPATPVDGPLAELARWRRRQQAVAP
jgi:uncharacterized protein (DUF58 family)